MIFPLHNFTFAFRSRLARPASRISANARKDGHDDLLKAIVAGESVASPIVAVVAHPDDETIGMGSRLSQLKNLTLVIVTDGAPTDMRRARSLGFESVEDYSSARFDELQKALGVLGAQLVRQINFGFPDGQTVFHLAELAGSIEAVIVNSAAVITHAYEGGHPDHDACSLATQLACTRIAAAGREAPQLLEFAGYHSQNGQLTVNRFWQDSCRPESMVRLSWKERRMKRRAMRAFRTQSFLLEHFPPSNECYRRAPAYDFPKPPPPGEWYYDRYDWSLKGKDWLRQVRDCFSPTELDQVARGIPTVTP
jgi:N-acetylglucosamine malate deacetylase 2